MNGNASLGESNRVYITNLHQKACFICFKSDLIDKLTNLIIFMVSSAEYAASEFTTYIVQ